MDKPASLRKALEKAMPYLAAHPDTLILEVDKGRIRPIANVLTFYEEYELNIYLLDYGGPIAAVIAHINNWLQMNQPELIRNPDLYANGYRFETTPINHDKADYLITLSLKEHVIVQVKEDGSLSIETKKEPNHYTAPLA